MLFRSGADTPDTSSPQAISGSNSNDPNARASATAVSNPNLILTPNEIDLENKDEILASDVQRSVPPPADELVKILRQRGQLKAATSTAPSAAATPNKSGNPLSSAPVPTAGKKKGFFGHLWP